MLNKIIITFVISVLIVTGAFLFIGSLSISKQSLGGLSGSEGDYISVGSGSNQVITTLPSVLRKVIIGESTDEVLIADADTYATADEVLNIDPSGAGSFDLNMVFKNGISAYVTASDKMVFIISPL